MDRLDGMKRMTMNKKVIYADSSKQLNHKG